MARHKFLVRSIAVSGLAILALSVLVACGTAPEATQTAVATPTILATQPVERPTSNAQPLRPGIYTTNEVDDLPLPTSGYELYAVGEPHIEREPRLLALNYLKVLHKTARVRDIILELSPAYERDVNAYVLGLEDTVSPDWSLGADVIIGVRIFNDTLPASEKVRVRLVDIDMTLDDTYAHLRILQEVLGTAATSMDLPSLFEFRNWDEAEMLALVDKMADLSQDRRDITRDITREITRELATVKDSIRSNVAWQRFGWGEISEHELVEQMSIREERIAQNTQTLLATLDGAPVLALYGGWHVQRQPALRVPWGGFSQSTTMDSNPPWVQRLAESGVSIYSVLAEGISGEGKVEGSYPERIERQPHEMRFSDGTKLGDVFDSAPQHSIVYVDLRLGMNGTLRLGDDFRDVPAGEIYDGIILFREVSPVEYEEYP